MNGLTDFVISGPLLIAGLLAVAAGALSFASPCCLPLVPGYLAYLTGLAATPNAPEPATSWASGPDAITPHAPARAAAPCRWRLAGAAALFAAGFTAVFTAEAMSVLGLSDLLALNQELLQRVGGVITIIMGLAFLGLVPALQRQARVRLAPRGGLGPDARLRPWTWPSVHRPSPGRRVGGSRDRLAAPPHPRHAADRWRAARGGRNAPGDRGVGRNHRLAPSWCTFER
jgi:hypothetical protein